MRKSVNITLPEETLELHGPGNRGRGPQPFHWRAAPGNLRDPISSSLGRSHSRVRCARWDFSTVAWPRTGDLCVPTSSRTVISFCR